MAAAGVENSDGAVCIDANNCVQRRIDDGGQPRLALVKFLVALRSAGAGLQGLTLGEQRSLVNDGANEVAISSCGFSMRAMCRSPVKSPLEPPEKTTSLLSLVPRSFACEKACATLSEC
jgi:hypothetical protein